MKCKLCLRPAKGKLCSRCANRFMYDSSVQGIRLKKLNNGTSTRYVRHKFHSHEIELTKILERYYGSSNIFTEYHPLWAVSPKGALLEYDVLIKNMSILVEYNGIQHYEFTKIFHKKRKRFEDQLERDRYKERLAIENGYKLVVIKYDEPLIEDYIVKKIGEHHGS